jgi:hypothetical protein
MSTRITHTENISDEFLSVTDRDYLAELVTDWLAENEHTPDEFEFQIKVRWTEEQNENNTASG